MFAVIMAGGSGTRLWPLSRQRTPKQLLQLVGDTSLLQQTAARVARVVAPHDTYVITSAAHVRATQQQLPLLPPDNVLGEPLARSTAVAAGLAMVLSRREEDEVCIVLPADHHVGNDEAFADALGEAVRTAERGYLVCLGVTPRHAATGYGYVKVGERLHAGSEAASVERFVEKPDSAKAQEMLEEGGYLWNAGIFAWRVYAFAQAVERFQPELSEALSRVASVRRLPGWMSEVREIIEPLPAVTLDVGIAEPAAAAGLMAAVPLAADWSDIGSWSALLEALTANGSSSLAVRGEHLDRDSRDILVHGGERLIVTVGLRDVIIVDTPDALLVCARDRAEDMKRVLDEIAQQTGDRYL